MCAHRLFLVAGGRGSIIMRCYRGWQPTTHTHTHSPNTHFSLIRELQGETQQLCQLIKTHVHTPNSAFFSPMCSSLPFQRCARAHTRPHARTHTRMGMNKAGLREESCVFFPLFCAFNLVPARARACARTHNGAACSVPASSGQPTQIVKWL